jgi:hypothetical protein
MDLNKTGIEKASGGLSSRQSAKHAESGKDASKICGRARLKEPLISSADPSCH